MGDAFPMPPRALLPRSRLLRPPASPPPTSRSPPTAEGFKTKEAEADAANWPDHSKGSPTPHAPAENPPAATTARSQQVAPPAAGERVVFIGNGFAERDTYYGRLETEAAAPFPGAGT
jgi:hypothetical protein